MDSDPRLVVFFIILSTNPKMLQMMNILVLYTTFQKIFTIIRIFLKSEAPKALYSSHSFIVSALIRNEILKMKS